MKNASITEAIHELRARLGADAFTIADHWEADRYAIGLSAPADQGRLVYISTYGKLPGRFDASLELPPIAGRDLPYTPAGDIADLDIEALAALLREQLHVSASRLSGRDEG